MKIRQNLPILSFSTFLGASRCSVSNFDYLALICESFDKIFLILQNSTLFCPDFHNFDTLIHVCYIKNKENFSLCTKFGFSKNSLWNFNFSYISILFPSSISLGKWKMFREIYRLLLWIFEQCEWFWWLISQPGKSIM